MLKIFIIPQMNRTSLILTLICFLVVFVGCRSRQPNSTQYYLIEHPEGKNGIVGDTIPVFPFNVEILPVYVDPSFATHRIAIRENTHEIRYFLNHQWAVRPEGALTRFVYDFLTRQRMFSQVAMRFWDVEPDLQFHANIYQLQVVKQNRKYFAHLNLGFQLADPKSGAILTEHKSDIQIELARRNLNLFASEISRAFYDELQVFAQKMRHDLLNHNK